MKKSKNNDTCVIFDVNSDSGRKAILKAAACSEFQIEENDGKIILHLKKEKCSLTQKWMQKAKKFFALPFLGMGAAPPEECSLVEDIARTQNISLANQETSGSIYSGIIAAPRKKQYFAH